MQAIGVLALQGDVREHLGALEQAGTNAVPVRRLAEIEAVDGLVIPGGESTTLWRLAVAFELLEPLRKLIAAGLPAFGSCAGMIMLADRLLPRGAAHQTVGGIATPADAAMMMQLGAEGVFVGSGIFKAGDPARRAAAIVKATTFYDDPDVVAKVSRGLGEAMVGINLDTLPPDQHFAGRGW